MRPSLFWGGILCLALPLAAAAQDASGAPPRPVILHEVGGAGGGLTRQFFGSVTARQTVDLAFQVGGQIVEFPAVEGETIPEGDLVARLDLEPFELALNQARLRAAQTERQLDRLTQLQGNAVSQVQVDDAQTEFELARVAVDEAELNLERATLRAPFDALVATREMANFTTIQAGTPVVRLHDMSEIRIEIDVPEILFQQAGNNPEVEILARFAAAPGREFPVTPREFNAEASTIGQTYQLTLGMAPPEGLAILPGASARIVATLGHGGGALRVPVEAVAISPDGETSVLVFEPAEGGGTGTLARRPVTLGADQDGRAVIEEGLEAGELIVAGGVEALEEGQTVRRFEGFPD